MRRRLELLSVTRHLPLPCLMEAPSAVVGPALALVEAARAAVADLGPEVRVAEPVNRHRIAGTSKQRGRKSRALVRRVDEHQAQVAEVVSGDRFAADRRRFEA